MKMDIRTKAILLSSMGFGLGVIIGTVITAVTATLSINDGNLHICAPEFVSFIGNELTAFIIQALVSGLLGVAGMGGSTVFSIEEWSLLRATATHFTLVVIGFFVTGFFLRWFSLDDIPELLITLSVYVFIYVVIWVSKYLYYKEEISEINKELITWKAEK